MCYLEECWKSIKNTCKLINTVKPILIFPPSVLFYIEKYFKFWSIIEGLLSSLYFILNIKFSFLPWPWSKPRRCYRIVQWDEILSPCHQDATVLYWRENASCLHKVSYKREHNHGQQQTDQRPIRQDFVVSIHVVLLANLKLSIC